jgi:hypothetical protein
MSVALKENLKEKLFEAFEELPTESQAEVVDFTEFLREKQLKKRSENEGENKRIAGLNKGEIWMSDDFNDELPDEFWFGKNGEIKERNKEKNDESVD